MALSLPYLGENCERVGISAQGIVNHILPALPISSITKGVVFELNAFRVNCNFSWNCFYEWLTLMVDDVLPLTRTAIKSLVFRLNKKLSELSRNKHSDQIVLLFQEPFFAQQSIPAVEHAQPSNVSAEVQQKVVVSAKPKLCVRNVNKKLKCKDEKIKEFKSEVSALSKENHGLHSCLATAQRASEKNRVALSRLNKKQENVIIEKDSQLLKLENCFNACMELLEKRIEDLMCEVEIARNERDQLAERLTEFESQTLKTKKHKQLYLDSVRQCCMELMSLNVSTQNVEKLIRSVLQHIAGMNVENLPKPSTLIEMTSEMKGLACQQLAEQLTRTKDLTLHNDGTSKFGQHYGGFQVSLPESSYSLGLCEMLTGSADLTLKSLQMILADIEAVAGDGIGDKILANIKNTTSDRHIVEKKFNGLLEEYRQEILPSVVAGWDALS